MPLERIGDTSNLLRKKQVAAVIPDPKDSTTLIVILKSGVKIWFTKDEAVAVWKMLCKEDRDWRGE